MAKYIYCVSNESMPYIYKIGISNLKINELLKDLFADNIPSPFQVEYIKKVSNADIILQGIYTTFSNYRTFKCKPYFKLELSEIINMLDSIEGEDDIRFNYLDTKSIEYFKNKKEDLEFYIRYRLGQRVFPEDKKYSGYNHLKLDFNAQDDNKNNDEILKLFNKFYIKNKIMLLSSKGYMAGLILDINDNTEYKHVSEIDENEDSIDFSAQTTIEVLSYLLRNI